MWFLSPYPRPLKFLLWTVPCRTLLLFSDYKGIQDDHLSCTFNRCVRPGEAGSDTNALLDVGLGGGCLAHHLMKYHRYYLQSKNMRSNLLFLLHVCLHPDVFSTLWPKSSLQTEPKFSLQPAWLVFEEDLRVPVPESSFSGFSRAEVVPREVHWGLYLWIFLIDAD